MINAIKKDSSNVILSYPIAPINLFLLLICSFDTFRLGVQAAGMIGALTGQRPTLAVKPKVLDLSLRF